MLGVRFHLALIFLVSLGLTTSIYANDNTQDPNGLTTREQLLQALAGKDEVENTHVLVLRDKKENFSRALELYEKGEFVKAIPYFVSATRQGHFKAPRYLGLIYLNGMGVKINTTKAFAYFVLAAQRGDITGQYWLGYLYETGTGVNQDMEQAIRWYTSSAQRGDIIAAPALTALGRFYEYGLGSLTRDLIKAKEYYQQAALDGYVPAQQALRNLEVQEQLKVTPDVSNIISQID
ncbi:tetratricopeptide repeat protein [Psittacicella gerlachiana]|uniref:Sel1 repeat family protein n=1 Tax=Psittacicella gerlachiana TaxID=2028574 RepID=A0A3A1YGU3_9GAMM|nr:tetratricopeptide repeat protein [Psittacicella gerlachiana]RIY36418.1 hypothetical protein CKF59_02795 [Psittacicella gerlachiana]